MLQIDVGALLGSFGLVGILIVIRRLVSSALAIPDLDVFADDKLVQSLDGTALPPRDRPRQPAPRRPAPAS